MNAVIALVITVVYNLPWLAVGLFAALAWRKRKSSRPLMLQTFGAAAALLLAGTQWLVIEVILKGLSVRQSFIQGGQNIFNFLIFVALATFALGYCLEHFSSRKFVDVTAKKVS